MMQNLEMKHKDTSLDYNKPKKIAWQMKPKLEDGIDPNIFSDNFSAFTVPGNLSLEINDIKDPLDVEVKKEELNEESQNSEEYLKLLVEEQSLEIKRLKKKLKSEMTLLTAGNLTSDAAASKIVELSRKIREVTAELESERSKTKQLNIQLSEMKYQLAAFPDSAKNGDALQFGKQNKNDLKQDEYLSDINELQEKLQQSNLKLSEYRNLCQTLKRELKATQKALQLEIGDESKYRAALTGTGWKGRAQLIMTLQNKISELKMQLAQPNTKSTFDSSRTKFPQTSPPTNFLNDDSPSSSSYDIKHREEIRRIEKEKKEAKQISVQNSQAIMNCVTSPSSAPVLRRTQRPADIFHIARRNIRSSDPVIDSMANERHSPVQQHTDEEIKPGNDFNEFRAMCQEYRIVAQATQVEKEKLLELVSLLNKRLDDAQTKMLQMEQHLHSVQHTNVQLEKELEKAALLGRKSNFVPRLTNGFDGSTGDNIPQVTAEDSLQSLKEENHLLKAALEKIILSKEEDVKIYQEIIEQTRKIFMDGLRQYNEDHT